MSAFDDAFARTVGVEGGYSNDPSDRGGATMYGITEAVARANGYTGAMRDLPLDTAREIYKAQYWDLLRLDDVALSAPAIASELFDTAVNSGVATAGRYLQQALNAFNRNETDYPDVEADGVVGPVTISAFRSFVAIRGDAGRTALMRALNALQGAGYIFDTITHPTDERFAFGWFMQRVSAA